MRKFNLLLIILSFIFISVSGAEASNPFTSADTDRVDSVLFGFFDLRDRESFIQLTNVDSASRLIHIQIYNVGDNCNENDFFDNFTPSDTHVYNLRDIVTNDGNPSGVVLPDNAYGIFIAIQADVTALSNNQFFIGNLRIEDISGYEYRTNLVGAGDRTDGPERSEIPVAIFNFNADNGVVLSDIILLAYDINTFSDPSNNEVLMAEVLDIWNLIDVDIYNLDEVPFSCRNVVFACVDEDNPLQEALLEEVADQSGAGASVASFEYGINETITHSRGGELLCPGNTISQGLVSLTSIDYDGTEHLVSFVGLNNGNGRGSMDAMFNQNGSPLFQN